MESIKVAHMSDLHYSADNLKESDRCFTAAVTEAIENGVHCAIITGDSTDHALDAHQPAVRALARQIKRLANHCPVLMLQGTFSHEPPGFLKMLSMVASKHPITVADKVGSFGLRLDGFAIEPVQSNANYSLVLHTLPTLNKADIAALAGDSTHSEARRIIANVLESWMPVNQALRQRGVPSLILSHGTVLSSISEHGIPMAGTDHELGLGSLFAAQASGVALGHIHKQQEWVETAEDHQQVIAYAGSIGRFHHGEIGDKFWLLWELNAEGAVIQKHQTPSRRTVDLCFDGVPDLDELRTRAQQCVGASVRLRYVVDEEHRQKVDRTAIRAILEAAGVQDVQIEGRTLIVQRQRAQGISTVGLEQKLALWCEATDTLGGKGLQARLAILLNDEPDAIAARILERLAVKAAPVVAHRLPQPPVPKKKPSKRSIEQPQPEAAQAVGELLDMDCF